MKRAAVFWALASIVLVAGPAAADEIGSGAAPVVSTAAGALQGTRVGAVDAFLGIPFAAPPTGERRWRAPDPLTPWEGVRQATVTGPACMQPNPRPFEPWTEEFITPPPVSEDCLYLNIWRPSVHIGSLPVLVWLHGGGFFTGSGAVPIYNGSALAARGVIVITINYRLGVFGFLAYPGLEDEGGGGVAANFGLLDQIAALRWVRANVAKFGGDPAKVTLAGQSAGAASVNNLLMSPMARGLFARAIAQSGSGMGEADRDLSRAEAERQGTTFASAAGASDLTALRSMPTDRLEAAFEGMQPRPNIEPYVDGRVVVSDPENAAKPQSEVPLLTGYTADEGAFYLLRKGPVTPATFEIMVRERYGQMAPQFLALYPHGDVASALQSTRDIARDRCNAGLIFWSEARGRASNAPLFLYRFDHRYPGPDSAFYRAFHSSEIPYVFGVLNAPGRVFTAKDRKIARKMQDVWLKFMRSGAPTWRSFRPAEPMVMELGDRIGSTPAVSTPERLAAFRKYVAEGGKLSFW